MPDRGQLIELRHDPAGIVMQQRIAAASAGQVSSSTTNRAKGQSRRRVSRRGMPMRLRFLDVCGIAIEVNLAVPDLLSKKILPCIRREG